MGWLGWLRSILFGCAFVFAWMLLYLYNTVVIEPFSYRINRSAVPTPFHRKQVESKKKKKNRKKEIDCVAGFYVCVSDGEEYIASTLHPYDDTRRRRRPRAPNTYTTCLSSDLQPMTYRYRSVRTHTFSSNAIQAPNVYFIFTVLLVFANKSIILSMLWDPRSIRVDRNVCARFFDCWTFFFATIDRQFSTVMKRSDGSRHILWKLNGSHLDKNRPIAILVNLLGPL